MANQDFGVIRPSDRLYPDRLNNLPDPPARLFTRGDIRLMEQPMIAIVGSRRCTEYGARISEKLAFDLASAGLVILSGLALGIDGCAHQGALRAGGSTVAVLGTGIDVIYPRTNRALQLAIAERGLLISEFEPGAPALQFHFPKRNRLIAALARIIVVVEATLKSGTTHTVREALDMGRDVFAVPGPIGRPTSDGTNSLLRTGAKVLLSAQDIFDALQFRVHDPDPTSGGGDPDPVLHGVWRAVHAEPGHVDDIAARCGISTRKTLETLLTLEIEGWVEQLPGTRFQRARRGLW